MTKCWYINTLALSKWNIMCDTNYISSIESCKLFFLIYSHNEKTFSAFACIQFTISKKTSGQFIYMCLTIFGIIKTIAFILLVSSFSFRTQLGKLSALRTHVISYVFFFLFYICGYMSCRFLCTGLENMCTLLTLSCVLYSFSLSIVHGEFHLWYRGLQFSVWNIYCAMCDHFQVGIGMTTVSIWCVWFFYFFVFSVCYMNYVY